MSFGNRSKCLRRGPCLHGKEPLHGVGILLEIGLENLKLQVTRNRRDSIALVFRTANKFDGAGCGCVLGPACMSTATDEIATAPKFEKIYGCGIHLPRFSASYAQEVDVLRTKTQPRNETDRLVHRS